MKIKFSFCNECLEHCCFKDLKPKEKENINFEKICLSYKRGDIVYSQKHNGGGVYAIQKGVLKLYKTGLDGKEQIIRFAKAGDLIGFRSLLNEEPFCTSARVLEDAILCYIPAKFFLNLRKNNSDFSMNLLKISCKELGDSNNFILDLSQKSLRARVAKILVMLNNTFGLDTDNYIQIELTREEMANLVGTATESVIRLLSDFKSDSLISISGRRIAILNLDRLLKIAT